MYDENQNLFPEKDLIDMRFMELLKYGGIELKTKEDIGNALRELTLLKRKRAEVSNLCKKMCKDIISKSDAINETLEYAMQGVRVNIEKCCKAHPEYFNFEDKDDSVSKAAMKLEHGEVVCITTEKTEFKIKPAKTNGQYSELQKEFS